MSFPYPSGLAQVYKYVLRAVPPYIENSDLEMSIARVTLPPTSHCQPGMPLYIGDHYTARVYEDKFNQL